MKIPWTEPFTFWMFILKSITKTEKEWNRDLTIVSATINYCNGEKRTFSKFNVPTEQKAEIYFIS